MCIWIAGSTLPTLLPETVTTLFIDCESELVFDGVCPKDAKAWRLFWWFTAVIHAHQIPLIMGFSSQEYRVGSILLSQSFPDVRV